MLFRSLPLRLSRHHRVAPTRSHHSSYTLNNLHTYKHVVCTDTLPDRGCETVVCLPNQRGPVGKVLPSQIPNIGIKWTLAFAGCEHHSLESDTLDNYVLAYF